MNSGKKYKVWSVMPTPFTVSGQLDCRGEEALIDWYLANRVDGIFSVCLSSEMFDLTAAERLEFVRQAVKRVGGAVPVVACGGFGDTEAERFRSICETADAGVEAVVLPLSVLFPQEYTPQQVADGLYAIAEKLPDILFGLYECPVPYKRLLPADQLGQLASDCPCFRFLKDTCCNREQLQAKSAAVVGTKLKIYNANLTTLTDSLRNGCAGFCGIAANFFPDALVEFMQRIETDPEQADHMQIVFNTLERNVEFHYPRGAKEFLKQQGLPLSDFCRTQCPGFTAEELEQIRDFGRFITLWRQSGYDPFNQGGQK